VIVQDVPPYLTVAGNPSSPHGINAEGLRRRGFSAQTIDGLRRAYRTLYKSGLTLAEAQAALAAEAAAVPELALWIDFLAVPGRGIVR
jgi:UDP-N-acetylglucosamine acyltransferase